jgi:RNA polymerase-binding transcription factor DksA
METAIPRSSAIPSPFTAAELAGWRKRLVALRGRTTRDLEQLADEARQDGPAEPAERDASASDQARQVMAAAAGNDQALVQAIDLALRRIDIGHPSPFGLCLVTGRPIERERLELMPWTPVSTHGATRLEADAARR